MYYVLLVYTELIKPGPQSSLDCEKGAARQFRPVQFFAELPAHSLFAFYLIQY